MLAKFPNELSDEDSGGHAVLRGHAAHACGDVAADRGERRRRNLRIGTGVEHLSELDHASPLLSGHDFARRRQDAKAVSLSLRNAKAKIIDNKAKIRADAPPAISMKI
jgi:hypothetical protein